MKAKLSFLSCLLTQLLQYKVNKSGIRIMYMVVFYIIIMTATYTYYVHAGGNETTIVLNVHGISHNVGGSDGVV